MSFGRERGVTSVYFLIFTIALLGLLTMAVDYGRFYVIQSELQSAADAAALAAVGFHRGRSDRQSDSSPHARSDQVRPDHRR